MSEISRERWPALLSRREAAEYLGVSESTVTRLKSTGHIKSVLVCDGTIIKYRRTDLDRYIEQLPEGEGVFGGRQGKRNRRTVVA